MLHRARLLTFCTLALAACPTSRTDSRASISGHVVLSDLAGASDLSRVRVDIGRGEGGTTVDGSGNFQLSDIEPDTYTLVVTYVGGIANSATGSAYRRYERRVVVAAGDAVNLPDIRLQLGTGSVQGTVGVEGGGDSAGSRVTLTRLPTDGTAVTGVVLDDGTFLVPDVPVGRYTMVVAREEAGRPVLGQLRQQGAAACGSQVTVDQDGVVTPVPAVNLAPTDVALSPGANDLHDAVGNTWFAVNGTVTLQVQASFAQEGRAWREGDDPPAYTAFQLGGYTSPALDDDDTTRVNLQFRDVCGWESPVYFRDIVHDVSPPQVVELRLNGGNPVTRVASVSSVVEAYDAVGIDGLRMKIALCRSAAADDAACVDALAQAPWEDYRRAQTLTLEDAQGAHHVLTRLRDRSAHESPIASATVVVDNMPPSCSLTLVGQRVDGTSHATHTANALVSYQVTCDAPPAEMLLVAGDNTPDCATGGYGAYAPTGSLLLVGGDGPGKRAQACFRDRAGNVAGPVGSNTLTLDTAAPAGVTLVVHDGSGWWNRADATAMNDVVPLTVSSLEDGTFEVDTDPAFASPGRGTGTVTAGLAGASSVVIPLTEGAAPEVFVRVQDAVGHSTVVSGRVRVDLTAPTGSVVVAGGAEYLNETSDGSATLTTVAADGTSGVARMVSYAGTGPCADGGAFAAFAETSTLQVVPPPASTAAEGEYTASVCIEDRAGNIGGPFRDTILLDRSPPSCTVTLTGRTVTGAAHATRTGSLAVDYAITCTRDPAAMILVAGDNTPDCAAGTYGAFVGTGSISLLPVDGPGKRVQACFRSASGNVAGPVSSNTLTLDTRPPGGVTLVVNGGRAWWNAADQAATGYSVPLAVSADEDGAFAVALTPNFAGATRMPFTAATAPASASITIGSVEGQLQDIHLRAWDEVGNETTVLGRVTVDITPPTASVMLANGLALLNSTSDGSVSVDITAADGLGTVTHMVVYAGTGPCSDGGTPVPFSRVSTLQLIPPPMSAAVPGPYVGSVCVRDQAGNTGGPFTDDITYDPDAPGCTVTLTGRTVAGGAHATRTATELVDYVAACGDPPVEMILVAGDNTPDCNAGAYSAFVAGGTVVLLSGDGPGKRVQACFRDSAGNITGPVSSNTLTLDRTAPSGVTLQVNGGAAWWNAADFARDGLVVPVVVAAQENGTYEVDTTPLFTNTSPTAYDRLVVPTTASVTVDGTEGLLQDVFLRLTDDVGNATVVSARITVDITPPSGSLVVAGGAAWLNRNSDGTVSMDATATDNVGNVARMATYAGAGPCPAASSFVGFAGSSTLQLVPSPTSGAPEGSYTASLCLADQAGNRSVPITRTLTFDRTTPTITAFSVDGGSLNLVRSPVVSLNLAVSEGALARLNGLALSNNTLDCTAAAYEPAVLDAAGTLTRSWVLSPGDGPKVVFACVRDQAGNTSAAASGSNPTVTLDTQAPAPGTLVLAGGADRVRSATGLSVALTGMGPGTSAVFSGDVVLPMGDDGVDPFGSVRTTLEVSSGDGSKTVSVVLVDDAGNVSFPFSDTVILDTVAPANGTVVLAGGQDPVNTQVIGVAVANTSADTMRLWEVGAAASCGACACGDALCGGASTAPFTTSSTFTLSATKSTKKVCWQFCDLAGNPSAIGSDTITLGTFLDRPRPTISSTTPNPSPPSHVAYSQASYTITIAGTGVASDTLAQVGDFTLPCTNAGAYSSCVASNPSGTCGTSCTVTLPSQVMRNSGSYLVRLFTPAPVAGGVGTSAESVFFNVVAPSPVITAYSPRGVTQAVDSSGLPTATTLGPSNPLRVWGRNFMDNVSFSLGSNTGQVVRFVDLPADSAYPNAAQRYAEVIITTAGLYPDLEPAELVAINPPPGGGQSARPFGVNPITSPCDGASSCAVDLRLVRTLHASTRQVVQGYSWPEVLTDGVAWFGGTAAGARDAQGRLLFRTTAPSSGGAVPLPLGHQTMFVESAGGSAPRVIMRAAAGRPDGTFSAGTGAPGPGAGISVNGQTAMAAGDIDGNGIIDVVTVNDGLPVASVWLNVDGTSVPQRTEYDVLANPWSVALGDVNGDGHLDFLVGHNNMSEAALRLGRGDGTFGPLTTWSMGTNRGLGAAFEDVDGDGNTDLLTFNRNLRFRLSRGDGTFKAVQAVTSGGDAIDFAMGDLNGDGLRDVVHGSGGSTVHIRFSNGDGTFTTGQSLVTEGNGVELADLNGDGAPDIISGCPSRFTVRLWSGTGASGYGADADRTSFDLGPCLHFSVQDMTGDGLADLFLAGDSSSGPGNVVVPGLGDGSFNVAGLYTTGQPRVRNALALDVNGDGAPDSVGIDINNNLVVQLSGTRTALGNTVYLTGTNGHAAEMVDLNKDGLWDLVIAATGEVRVHLGVAGALPSATPSYTRTISGDGRDITAGDFNQDGNPDIATVGGGTNRLSVLVGTGTGDLAAAVTYTTPSTPTRVESADISRDGIPDLVVFAEGGGTQDVAIYTNDGTGDFDTLATQYVDMNFNGARDMVLADFNGDGLRDLVVGNAYNDPVPARIRLQLPGGAFGADSSIGTWFGPGAFRTFDFDAADIDGDGRLDLVAGRENSDVTWRLGNGRGAFGSPFVTSGSESSLFIDEGDINGDGIIDLAHSRDTVSALQFRQGDRLALNTFAASADHPTSEGGDGLALGDITNDGIPDIIRPQQGSTLVRVASSANRWEQELTDMPAATVSAPAGALTRLDVHQASQRVERLGVRVRLFDPGMNLQNVKLRLRAPSGTEVVLFDAANMACTANWSGTTTLLAHYPTSPMCTGITFTPLLGWQGDGDWSLLVDNGGPAAIQVQDFAVITRGVLHQDRGRGRAAATPEVLELVPGRAGLVVDGTTLGYPNTERIGCVTTDGAPNHYYSFTLDTAQRVTARLVGDFDASLAIRETPCSTGINGFCADDGGGGKNPLLAGRYMPAGTHCAIVDGQVTGGKIHSGNYQLTLVRGASACDVAPEIASAINATAVSGTLAYGANEFTSTCGGGSGNDVVYQLTPPAAGTITLSTDSTATTANTVLSVRTTCNSSASQVACNNDISGTNTRSRVSFTATAGTTYYVIVDSATSSQGAYALTVTSP